MENIKEQLEEVIKKNLPENKKKSFIKSSGIGMDNDAYKHYSGIVDGFNQALSQINPSIIADEVLKVVEENYRQAFIKTFLGAGELWFNYFWEDEEEKEQSIEEINDLWKELLDNSNTLEGEQSEHLSPNKENKNNE